MESKGTSGIFSQYAEGSSDVPGEEKAADIFTEGTLYGNSGKPIWTEIR